MRYLLALLLVLVSTQSIQAKEKYFVVERESNSVAIIEDGLTKRHMQNMHNMNHGIIKFDGDDA
jgi:protein NirF